MRKFRYNYLPITERALTDTFFIDPGLVRRIVERDHTVIFTDGSRSVLLRPEQQTITFTDPALPHHIEEPSNEDKLRSAVAFINKHLGWVDTYYFDQMEKRQDKSDGIRFRKHLGSYPLIGNNGQDTETISVTIEQGQIVSLKQSLIDLDIYIDYETWRIMSGPELYEQLRVEGEPLHNIKDAYLAYETKVYSNHVELSPVWVLEKQGGARIVRTARMQPKEEVNNGLE
jgi:regulatory protein YycH of two-component signal transduction system YycFG